MESSPSTDPERGAQRRDEWRGTPRRGRILLAVAAAASALLVGLGAGWLLFGRDTGPAMDAKQRSAWTEFEASGKYDAGSIRMLGEQYGITAWYATQEDGSTECLMLTPSKQVSIGCLPTNREEQGQGYSMPLSTQVRFGDDEGTTVNGYVVRDVRGTPTVVMQKWESQASNWADMFSGDERDIAELIVDETGVPGDFLQIVGYDGDTPIWLTQNVETCLYAADLGGISQQSCSADTTEVTISLPNATYGLRDTNMGPRLTTTFSHDSLVTGEQAAE